MSIWDRPAFGRVKATASGVDLPRTAAADHPSTTVPTSRSAVRA